MKVKDAFMQQQEFEFELDLSYREWLMENFSEPSEMEINEMERDCYQSQTVSNRIVTLKPLNNIDYYPKLGA